MIDEREENVSFEPSVAVTTVIKSLPKVGESTTTKPPRKKQSRSGKKHSKKSAKKEPTSPQVVEAPRSSVWLSAISNLILLIAIFTIVFAAHRAIQKNKIEIAQETQQTVQTETAEKTPTPVETTTQPETATTTETASTNLPPEASAETVAQEEAKEAVKTETQKTEETKESAVAENKPEEKAEKKVEENVVVKEDTAPSEKPKPVARKKDFSDPYTSGGPLDLDRRENTNVIEALKEESSITKNIGTDHRNPWNGGGHQDLDNPNTREEYLKNNYISITEPANDNNQ